MAGDNIPFYKSNAVAWGTIYDYVANRCLQIGGLGEEGSPVAFERGARI